MKTKNIIILGALAVASLTTVTSCNDFEDINKDPNKADLEQVEPEWFLNGSIGDAQMNPEIAERIFILYWKRAARFDRGSGFAIGTDNDDYNRLYLTSNSYGVGWLNKANQAIEVGEEKIKVGHGITYNTKQIIYTSTVICSVPSDTLLTEGFAILCML